MSIKRQHNFSISFSIRKQIVSMNDPRLQSQTVCWKYNTQLQQDQKHVQVGAIPIWNVHE